MEDLFAKRGWQIRIYTSNASRENVKNSKMIMINDFQTIVNCSLELKESCKPIFSTEVLILQQI